MKKLIAFDCETDPFAWERVPQPFIWDAFDGEEHFTTRSTGDFIAWLSGQNAVAYAHNGGKFDFHFLLDALAPDTKIMVVNGRIAKMQIGKCELRDSWMLFPVPLAAYQKDEIDYSIMEKSTREEHIEEITRYLHGDTRYLWQLLQAQREEYGQKLTLAGSAFDVWKSKFSGGKKPPKTYKGFFDEYRPFYYGGRVQCFHKGIVKEPFQVFDINSAYPSAMLNEHPYGNTMTVSGTFDESCPGLQFVECMAISDGAFPFREKDGSLTFPADGVTRHYKVTGWEFARALELERVKIIRVERVHKFLDSIDFSDYVHHFYAEKARHKGGDKAKYLLAKLYLNSLYGKFGQNPEKHRDYTLIEPWYIEDYVNDGAIFEGELGQLALISRPVAEHKQQYFNVATAASITGWVRAFMFDAICKADGVLYCDTDSIACRSFGGELGKELGQWDKEGDFDAGAIAGKKLYAFKYLGQDKYKISSKGAKLNHKDIFSIAKGEEVLYKNIAPTFSIGKDTAFIERKIRMT
jgi:hypothetical protein